MPAFLSALNAGYHTIETDPQITRDGVVVLMHDDTINRTCRHEDGSLIEKPIRISETTYKELLSYDAGIALGEQFRGTHIPRLDELLLAAEGRDVAIALDKKITTDRVDALIDVVLRHRARVSFSTSDTGRIRKIQARMPDAMFDYDVNLYDDALREVATLVKPENLMIWMYLDKPNFAWLAVRLSAAVSDFYGSTPTLLRFLWAIWAVFLWAAHLAHLPFCRKTSF
jgi:glycerophosphoryl diester phosphodiesterase